MKRGKKYSFLCVMMLWHAMVFAQPNHLQSLIDEPEVLSVLKSNENVEDKIRRNVFVDVSASKKSVFTGEPFIVTYRLCTAMFSESSVKQQPFFSGCSVQELPVENSLYDEVIRGKKYHVFIVRKVLLTPLREGTLQLGILSIDNLVSFITADDPFKTQHYNLTLSSEPLAVEVLPLPAKDKPANFSGAVGKFTIAAKTDTNNIPAGENAHLQITIQGWGNMDGINLPFINWPAAMEHFDATDTQRLVQVDFPLKSDKKFDVPFIGIKEGVSIIPPVYFSYFDPTAQTYKTIHTDSLKMMFTKAISQKQMLQNIVSHDVSNRKYLWIVPAMGIIVFMIWIISSKKKIAKSKKIKDTSATKFETSRKTEDKNDAIQNTGNDIHNIHNSIHQSANTQTSLPRLVTNFTIELQTLASLDDDHAFFLLAKALLTQAIQEKCSITETAELTLLHTLKCHTEICMLTDTTEKLYKTCNLALYAPVLASGEEKAMVCTQLSFVIKQMGLS